MKYIAEIKASKDRKYYMPNVREYYLRLCGKCLYVNDFLDSDFRKLRSNKK